MKIIIPGKGPITIYSHTHHDIDIPGDGPIHVDHAGGGPSGAALLMETGSYLLLETGDYILMEA